MSAFLLLILCLVAGFVVARIGNPPPTLATGLNWWVLHIALPATVLRLVPHLSLTWDMWFLAVSMWAVFGIAWLLFASAGKVFAWSNRRVGALTLVCGLGNTSFIGYPMIEAFRGQEGLALAVVADQVGCFVMLTLGGALVTSLYSGTRTDLGAVAKRVILFPPFIALLLGLAVRSTGGWPESVDSILNRLGLTLVPLALFSVGLQVHAQFNRDQIGAATVGLAYKLAIAPLAIYVLGVATGVSGNTLSVATLQAAMAPMVSATLLAEQHDLEPRLANLVLISGIAVSFVTVPLINAVL